MANVVFTVRSKSGKNTRLTERIWGKIRESHPEFQLSLGYADEIGAAIEDPDYVVRGWTDEYLSLRWCETAPGRPKHLCVVYRELNDEAFVVTAFFVTRYERLLRREVVWRRS